MGLEEFAKRYGVARTRDGLVLYKFFNARNGKLISPFREYAYEPGRDYSSPVDMDSSNDCGEGVNVAALEWILSTPVYYSLDEPVVLEAVIPNGADICIPGDGGGKVRASRVLLGKEPLAHDALVAAAARTPLTAYLYGKHAQSTDARLQDAVVNDPAFAFQYARDVPGADLRRFEDAVLGDARCAHLFARHVKGADVRKLQPAAARSPEYAFYFACSIPGADLKFLERAAAKDPEFAFKYAIYIEGADIPFLQRAASRDPRWAYEFARQVRGAGPPDGPRFTLPRAHARQP